MLLHSLNGKVFLHSFSSHTRNVEYIIVIVSVPHQGPNCVKISTSKFPWYYRRSRFKTLTARHYMNVCSTTTELSRIYSQVSVHKIATRIRAHFHHMCISLRLLKFLFARKKCIAFSLQNAKYLQALDSNRKERKHHLLSFLFISFSTRQNNSVHLPNRHNCISFILSLFNWGKCFNL